MAQLYDFSFQGLSKEEFYKYVVIPEIITQVLMTETCMSHRKVTEELFGRCLHHLEILNKVCITRFSTCY